MFDLDLLSWQVLITIAYSHQFKFPLTVTEVKHRLVSKAYAQSFLRRKGLSYNFKSSTGLTIKEALNSLTKLKLLRSKEGYYWLATSDSSLVDLRGKRRKISQEKRQQLTLLKKIFKFVPGIIGAGLTGSLALNNASQHDDLDLIIITKNRRLWLSRTALLIVALFLGKKSWPWQDKKEQWCFNLWLSIDGLEVPKKKHNLYTAYELMQIDWFYDLANIKQSILLSNIWGKEFLIDWPDKAVKQANNYSTSRITSKLDYWLHELQSRHLERKDRIPNKNISLNQAFLHDDVSFKQYQYGWQEILIKMINQKHTENDIYRLPFKVRQLLSEAREKNKKIVLVTGVFDVLHQEHDRFLRNSKEQGDVLIVGLETDKRVKLLKGPDRPVNSEEVRQNNLIQLGKADAVFMLPEKFDTNQDHENLIKLIRPDILAVSSHTPFIDIKRKIMAKVNGKLKIVLAHNPAISSTKLIKEKQERN